MTDPHPTHLLPGAALPCQQVATDMFFPDEVTHGVLRDAKTVCRGCPIRAACLDYAIANFEVGLWAGTSENQRARIRAKRRKAGKKTLRRTEVRQREVHRLTEAGLTAREVATTLGVTDRTVVRLRSSIRAATKVAQ